MLRLCGSSVFISWLMGSLVQASSEVAEGAHEAAHEAPNLFGGDIWLSIFTLAIFVILLAILGKFAWGPILSGLQKREEHIRNSIEEAQNARQEAEKALAEYKEQLVKANQEAQAIIEKGREDATRIAQELQEKTQDEAQKLRDRAQQDIATAKNQAINEIYDQVAVLATDIAGKIVSKTLSPDDHRQLLDESLSKIQADD